MKLNKIKESYLNISGNIYDSEMINLVNITDDKLAFDKNTIFLSEDEKEKLNSDKIKKFENCAYIFEKNGIYGLICDIPISEYNDEKIKNHELVIPETIQGMLSNFYGYNGEAAPTLLLHQDKVDLKQILGNNTYDYVKIVEDIIIYVYIDKNADALLSEYERIKYMYVGDGHHRLYATSLADFKQKVLSCVISIEDVKLLPIHRKLRNIKRIECENAVTFIKNKFEVIETTRKEKIKKGYVRLSFEDNCFLVKLIDLKSDAFWNNDVYRMNTQIINQAFRIFDYTQVSFISPLDSYSLNADEVVIELSELPKLEFITAAESQSILPPKSTWMSFKFPSLLIMSIYK